MGYLFFLLLFSVAVVPARETTAAANLDQVRSLKCNFTASTTTEWKSGKPATQKTKGFDNPIFYDSINRKDGAARMIGNAGAVDISVLNFGEGASSKLHFLQVTGTGNMTLTSVYQQAASGGQFAAVHSRHIDIAGTIVTSQYVGACVRYD